jgi:hypothetical protein
MTEEQASICPLCGRPSIVEKREFDRNAGLKVVTFYCFFCKKRRTVYISEESNERQG